MCMTCTYHTYSDAIIMRQKILCQLPYDTHDLINVICLIIADNAMAYKFEDEFVALHKGYRFGKGEGC